MTVSNLLLTLSLFFLFSFFLLNIISFILVTVKSPKDLSAYIGVLGLLTVGFGFGFSKYQTYELNHYGILTNGALIFVDDESLEFSYTALGVVYHRTYDLAGDYYNSYQKGETFKVLYSPESPDNYKLLLSQPVLLGDFEETYSKHFTLIAEKAVRFIYEVKGKEYERKHIFLDEIKIDMNRKYLVKYRVDNPQIAYIFLDKWEE